MVFLVASEVIESVDNARNDVGQGVGAAGEYRDSGSVWLSSPWFKVAHETIGAVRLRSPLLHWGSNGRAARAAEPGKVCHFAARRKVGRTGRFQEEVPTRAHSGRSHRRCSHRLRSGTESTSHGPGRGPVRLRSDCCGESPGHGPGAVRKATAGVHLAGLRGGND